MLEQDDEIKLQLLKSEYDKIIASSCSFCSQDIIL